MVSAGDRAAASRSAARLRRSREAVVIGAIIEGVGVRILPVLSAVLLFVLGMAIPASAQAPSPELIEGMKAAAGAYERKDYATALALWRKFAAEGNAEAETLLGAMYWSGDGVPRDHVEAARLYLSAAHKGYARAQNDIGFMYGF